MQSEEAIQEVLETIREAKQNHARDSLKWKTLARVETTLLWVLGDPDGKTRFKILLDGVLEDE